MNPRTLPRTALAAIALSALVLAACGSDSSSSSSDTTAADLDGRSFVSSAVTGYELVADSEIKLAFLPDSIAANAGCNSMNGGFSIDAGVLTAGPFASTMMACDQPLMDQDTWLSDFLTSSPTVALDGSTLTLTGADATITLDEVQPTALTGTTWNVTGTVATEAISSVPTDSMASITIADDGKVAVKTGCNNGSGGVEITDTTLTFGPIATTKMACEQPLMDLEASVTSVLQGKVTYEINGDALSLRSGTGADAIGLELIAAS